MSSMVTRQKESILCSAWFAWGATFSFAMGMSHIWGYRCPLRYLTGFDCPACGGTRAVVSLVHGHIAQALHYNLMVVTLTVCVTLYAVMAAYGPDIKGRLTDSFLARNRGLLFALSLLIWTFIRNLPQFRWLRSDWNQL